ncbi:predicted protein, partial [Arabidopsis lyrata subsp. lyrata]
MVVVNHYLPQLTQRCFTNSNEHLTMQIEPPSTIVDTENDNEANDNVVEVTNIESGCKIDETVPPKTDEEILGDIDDDLLSLMHELPPQSMFDI